MADSYRTLNTDGSCPLLLVCDHASNAVPAEYDHLGLSAEPLGWHISWDIGAARVTELLSEALDAPAVFSCWSRLLIDCNRQPGDPTSIPAVSDGVRVPANAAVDDAEADRRLERFFWPYHHAVTRQLSHLLRHGLPPLFVAVHSFTPQMAGGTPRPWQIGVLWNRDPRLAVPLIDRLRAEPGLCVGDNEPYSGRESGYTAEAHAAAAGLPYVVLEIRQDLIADEAGCRHWAGLLGTVLRELLADRSLHHIRHF